MKNKLLLAKNTSEAVKSFLRNPAQFLIIAGQAGAGKKSLAIEIGSNVLGQEIAAEHPKVLHISLRPNKSEISIDQVRELIGKLKLTTVGEGEFRRLVIIENGQFLSEEAQNSLLKLLEEPPADTQIIMTVDAAGSVLETITSRGQIIDVHPVELFAAQQFFANEYSESEVRKAWLLADGLPGLTAALLRNDEQHELRTAVAAAKKFISSNKYQRLTMSSDFTRNKRQLELLIDGLQKVVKTAQYQSLKHGRQVNHAKITTARRRLDDLHDALRANVSAKTVYLKLCLNLGI